MVVRAWQEAPWQGWRVRQGRVPGFLKPEVHGSRPAFCRPGPGKWGWGWGKWGSLCVSLSLHRQLRLLADQLGSSPVLKPPPPQPQNSRSCVPAVARIFCASLQQKSFKSPPDMGFKVPPGGLSHRTEDAESQAPRGRSSACPTCQYGRISSPAFCYQQGCPLSSLPACTLELRFLGAPLFLQPLLMD